MDTEEALQTSGDLIGPLSRGVLHADDVQGTLTTLCKGLATGRKAPTVNAAMARGTAMEPLAPPRFSTMPRVSARPRPVPMRFVVKNGSNTRGKSRGEMPAPVSVT